jgi:hypothetical protein
MSSDGVVARSTAGLIEDYRSAVAPPPDARQPADLTFLGDTGPNSFDRVFPLALAELRRRAAAAGADAVVHMRAAIDMAASDRGRVYFTVSGTAVTLGRRGWRRWFARRAARIDS